MQNLRCSAKKKAKILKRNYHRDTRFDKENFKFNFLKMLKERGL